MKAKHRHELKTNELAEWIADFPRWARENLTMLIIVSAAIVVAIVSLVYLRRQRNVVSVGERVNLTRLISGLWQSKQGVLTDHTKGTDSSYMLLQLARELEASANSAKNDRLAALAFIKRAEALRAELHYRPAAVGSGYLQDQLKLAKESYQKALARITQYGQPDSPASESPVETNEPPSGNKQTSSGYKYPLITAMAQFGLGICDEELGNFEEAHKLYQALASNPEFEATVVAVQARQRLETMADYKNKIVFRTIAPPEPTIPTPSMIRLPVFEAPVAEPTPKTRPLKPVVEANLGDSNVSGVNEVADEPKQ